ncbi:efflux RND transporter periplasmic adaptor subunit [Comamonas sp. Z3]|uniref:efflux RND transporter periplasmic adaptor subunit n=1 Tax=Comamonas sp. Z3 TaxID=2601247 RepID=UPI0011E7B27E|nr:efflux RND transporter periplasmic adaptor subunit [Comamonas sp. Z3]TYK69520.1 efflux RND transporter periplasmic adaptor subunit [Comamonas sp. Z3]TYK70529.1 efflux RND transporter periplasmic adaptor subunit [Comamonas sp. Z3]
MYLYQWLLAGALALPVTGMAAEAVPLSPEQARTLGVRFQSIKSSGELNVSAHARVLLRPDAQVVVAAPYAGMLPRVLVAVGQSVRAGQPVATFASPQLYEARRAVAQAESQSRLAQQALTRDRMLHDDGIIAASRWQTTQAHAVEAAAMAQARRAELAASGVKMDGKEAQLLAPRAGIVTEVMVQPGTRVEASAALVRVADPKALELDLLLGREVPLPAVGDRVQVATRAATGRVEGIAPVGDGSAGMRVRVALSNNGDLRLGESVTAMLTLKESGTGKAQANAADRLRIPAAALVYWQGQSGVFIETGQSMRFTALSVETRDEATAVVRGRLPAGAQIAVAGIAALKSLLSGGE